MKHVGTNVEWELGMEIVGTLPQESLAEGLWPRTIEELLAFIGLSDKKEVDISSRINSLFGQIANVTDSLITATIEKRTAAEFSATARALFNDYVRVLRAKSDLLQVVLRNDVHATERIVNQTLCELEADFRDNGVQRFGTSASEQAIFTVWTIRKTAALIWKLFDPQVINRKLPEDSVKKGEQFRSEFALYSAWAQFHLECLTTSMRLNKALYPDVLPAVMDGLRSEVNAYAIAKQIVDLYLPPAPEPELTPYAWDEEDDELLASSMQDMELEEL
ncbi:MAG: hypothetical protein ABSB67_12715 [Bryobacteraceae bacterium]|jgi:hypothetical protein